MSGQRLMLALVKAAESGDPLKGLEVLNDDPGGGERVYVPVDRRDAELARRDALVFKLRQSGMPVKTVQRELAKQGFIISERTIRRIMTYFN